MRRGFFRDAVYIQNPQGKRRRVFLRNPTEASRIEIGDQDTQRYVSSWMSLAKFAIVSFLCDIFPQRRYWGDEEMWENRRQTRVGDILDKPYTGSSEVQREVHVFPEHALLYETIGGIRLQMPLISTKPILNALVFSQQCSKDHVTAFIRSLPYTA